MNKLTKMLTLAMLVLGLAACGQTNTDEKSETTSDEPKTEQVAEKSDDKETENKTSDVKDLNGNGFTINQDIPEEDKPEITEIRWAVVPNGNIMYEIAKDKGYFEDYGVEVIDTKIAIETDSFAALNSDKVDVLSGSGTSGPLRQIAAGNDFTIFGGHMVTGAEAIFTRKDVEWNSIDDFIGKKMAGQPTSYWLTGPLLEKGYDPVNDIDWVQLPNITDNIAAVQSGEVDFASIVTSQHYQVENMDDIKIVAYSDDFMPNHSCCRMLSRTDWVNNNPNTIKAIHKALIRAKRDFDADRESYVPLMAKAIGTNEDHVASFLLNEHFKVSADPLSNINKAAWNTLFETGYLGDDVTVKIEDHINKDLYKEALEELIEERGDEDPEYYEKQLEIYKEYNE